MDVDQSPGIVLYKAGGQNAHEAGQYDQFHAMAFEFGRDGAIESLAIGMVAVGDDTLPTVTRPSPRTEK